MLSDRLRESYRRHGVAYPIPVLAPEEVGRYRAACDELELLLGGNPRTIEVRQMHLHFDWAHQLATQPRVLDAVQQLLGPNLLIWATELFAKRAHDPNLFIAWHRDRPYMDFDASLTTTAWIALAPSVRENGCLQVALEDDRVHSRLDFKRDGNVTLHSAQIEDVILQPGEMSLHDIDVYHGSGPNLSAQKRVGMAIRYVTPEACPIQGRPRVTLARGCDNHGNFEIVAAPEPGDAASAVAGLRKSALAHLDAMLSNLKRARPGP